MPGSVSIKSTGFRTPSTKSVDMCNDVSDPANPHIAMGKTFGPDSGPMPAEKGEYRETPTELMTEKGVGSFTGNDASNEKIVKHP